MKTIGLIGGMSWESTIEYYRIINERVQETLGGLHSAKILLYSLDFEEVAALQRCGDWKTAGEKLVNAAKTLEAAGADCVVVCTNTMHIVAGDIRANCQIPLLHIGAAVGEALRKQGIKRVGLLGTRFTMEQPFLKEFLAQNYGLSVIIPEEDARIEIHRVIFEELCCGKIVATSRAFYERVTSDLGKSGAQAVVLGCTEIVLLLNNYCGTPPVFDTTALHAEAAVRFALS